MPVQIPGKGWNVRARTDTGELWLTTGAPYTLAQAELAANNLRRDINRHGESVLGGMLIGLI